MCIWCPSRGQRLPLPFPVPASTQVGNYHNEAVLSNSFNGLGKDVSTAIIIIPENRRAFTSF